MLSPPELESGSQGESIGRRFYAVRESTPGLLCLALHAALALSPLDTVDSDSDHAHFSWSTHEPKSHWSPAAVRPCYASPRSLIADSELPLPGPRRWTLPRSTRTTCCPQVRKQGARGGNRAAPAGEREPRPVRLGASPLAPPAWAHLQRCPRTPHRGSHIRGPRSLPAR